MENKALLLNFTKPRSKSSVWLYFGFKGDKNGQPLNPDEAICRLCRKIVLVKSGNTTNLRSHLTRRHRADFFELREITKDRGSGGNDCFRHLIHTLLPSNKELPSPSQLENLLKEHHTKGKACLAHQLRIISGTQEVVPDYTAPIEPRRRGQHPIDRREIPNNVTLSVDIWSHNWHGTSEPYLTLWAHCIDLNYNSKNVALTSQRLMGRAVKDYTIQTIVAQVKAMAQEWGISQSNLVLIGGEGRKKMIRPTWDKLYPLLSILIKHKSPFCELIKEVTGEGSGNAEAPSENSSSSNCPTNSTSNCSSANSTMRSDWKVVEDLCLVLRPLDVACRTLAKEGFPRLSLVKPILIGLLSRHLVSRQGDSSSSILREVKRMMRKSLASCYDNPVVNMVLCVACSLDPQRIIQIKRSPSTESPESEGDILRRSKRLKNNHRVIFKDILDKHKYEKEDEDEHVNEDEESDAFETDDNDSVDCSSQAGQSGMDSVEESVDMEMSIFRADKGASLGVEPLQWWRTTGGQFPLLSTVARAYLAVPAVAGSAAKDFAQEGPCTLYRKRANIPPETLDAVLFLHHNHMPDTEPGLTTFRSEDKNNP
uniref:BED-type domain-containing protein n=1 Tax=Cynoglossus semilaevis TaxID=244447 RepID=A0A3P8W7J8_CYNSE